MASPPSGRDEQALTVYVPAPGSSLHDRIWEGSGIVGSEEAKTGRLRIDFEGDQTLYPTYEARVKRAAERHLWSGGSRTGYPTRACAHCAHEHVTAVGRYDPQTDRFEVDDRPALAEWIGEEEMPQ